MFVLDSTGFFSLVSLIIQCILAWMFAAFFGVLSPERSVWFSRWRTAFLGLGIGLLAVTVRFVLAYRHGADPRLVGEGTLMTRACYGVYLAGKVSFLWFLVGGIAVLRAGPWPRHRGWHVGAGLLVAASVGASLPTVECLLLLQAPLAVLGFAYAAGLLRRRPGEHPEVGRRIVAVALGTWAVVWGGYALCLAVVGPVRPDTNSSWDIPLRLNPLIDLTLQVTLAVGLIVVVLQDAQRTTVAALEERDLLREQVRRDEKLRALSTLVSGVAHEINNPLTAILGYADELSHESPAVRSEAAGVVREQADRCRKIVQRLSVLGRQPTLARVAVDVEAAVQLVVRGFQPQAAQAGVGLVLEFDHAQRVLHADPTAVEQVLTNIVANALHASPRGGRIDIQTAARRDCLVVAVADQGNGVPGAVRARIFDPFWTTKAPGQGTGLGLAVARALAQAHGGDIGVEDAEGGGARFVVELPWGEPAAMASPAAAPRPEAPVVLVPAPTAAARRLLIVDDEEAVRTTIARHATREGWRFVAVASAEDALQLVLDRAEVFDAVICDLRMPGMSGSQFHDRLVECAPALLNRLVFVTGDLASAEAMAFAARCRAPIFTKPFSFSELFVRLRDLGQVV